MNKEECVTIPENAEPSVNNAALTVYRLMGRPNSQDMSLGLIFLHGTNDRVRNLESEAQYMVVAGMALFVVATEGGNEVHELLAGQSVKILAGQWYQDIGHAAMVSLNHEAFNPETVEYDKIFEPVLSGEKVTIQKFSMSDATDIFGLIDRNRDHLSQYEEETAIKYPTLRSVVESLANPKPRRRRYAIRNGDGMYVGTINMQTHQNNSHIAEIGYYLGSEFQGNGYMVDAARTLTDHAFRDLDVHLMYGLVHPDNIGSQRVLERSGYTYTRKQQVEHDGHFVSCLRYEKRRSI